MGKMTTKPTRGRDMPDDESDPVAGNGDGGNEEIQATNVDEANSVTDLLAELFVLRRAGALSHDDYVMAKLAVIRRL
jgi:hypothetical protein